MELHEAEGGRARMSLDIEERLHNSVGIAHGGVLCALADVAAGIAAISVLGKGEAPLTTDFNIAYFKQAGDGELVCKAEVIYKSGKRVRAESSIFQDGDLIAKAAATFAVVKQ
jgi:acyl-CoA thioesterase